MMKIIWLKKTQTGTYSKSSQSFFFVPRDIYHLNSIILAKRVPKRAKKEKDQTAQGDADWYSKRLLSS